MPASSQAKLLIVDDDKAQMKALCDTLEPAGYTTTGFTSTRAALAVLQDQPFDLVLTDLNMPEMDGITFLKAAREIDSDLVGIVMTGQGAINTAVQAMQAGALDYIVKPFRLSAVLPVLSRALGVRQLRLENIDLQQAVGIYELSMAIRSTLDFDEVLRKVADAAMAHGQVRCVSILAPIEDGKTLRVAVARGENAERNVGKQFPIDSALSRWIDWHLKEASGAADDTAMQLSLPQMPDGSFLPMLAGGRFTGILNFISKNPRRVDTPGQIKALKVLAGAGASALDAVFLLEQLRSAERRYHSLSESAADVIFRYELLPQPRLTYINPAATSITGYSPAEFYADPCLILKFVHAEDHSLMETVLRGGLPTGSTVTLRCIHRKGNTIWIEQRNTLVHDADGHLIAIDCIARDVTERKQLEEQLRQSQKMEAIGLLAGGVAHDFNNLLTVISGYSDMILADDAPSASTIDKIGQIKRASEQAAALTRGLLAFGRREILQPRVLNMNAVVESSSKILRRIIGEDIELATSLHAQQGSVKADPGQMEQILMNLVVNAKGAMPKGGRITLETQDVAAEQTVSPGALSAGSGPFVLLAVTDTGCGMDAATQARIFEPFFTTKGLGQGTGLGLSIVYGIVKQGGGIIRVFSEPGSGARFEILLPRAESIDEEREFTKMAPQHAHGAETILVVEDDIGVRQLIGAVLKKGGYQVMIANDGHDALRICQEDEGKIGLILTDVVMPGMDGPTLLETLRQFNGSMKALFMSGYAGDTLASIEGPNQEVPFIQKPFTSGNLLGKVREVLDSRVAAKAKG